MATHPKTLEELHRRHNMHTLSGIGAYGTNAMSPMPGTGW